MTGPSGPARATATITREAAATLVAAARHAGRERGVAIAVAVTDVGGHLRSFERDDDAPAFTAEVAMRKAWTAASSGMATLDWNALIADRDIAPLAHIARMMPVGGGYPVTYGGQVIGGIGVSGGPVEQDCAVALAALAALPSSGD